MTPAPLSLRRVQSKQDLRQFLSLPYKIFAGDPAWVPPLLLERRMHLDPKQNPFFQHAEVAYWIAWRGEEPVGRISAQVNRASLEHRKDATGQFGFLDAVDDPEVFAALLREAESWLAAQGLRRATGPFSLSINDESGLLVEGFETPPYFMMGHARPYYGGHVEATGYRKAVDLLAYVIDAAEPGVGAHTASLIARLERDPKVTFRNLRKDRIVEDVRAILDIFNDAWSENWGYVPFSEAEVLQLAKDLKLLIHPDYLSLIELDGEAVAFGLILPNVNEAIAGLDGRLLPFGWAKLLWRLKVKGLRSARMPLMGIKKRFHASIFGGALAYAVIDRLETAARAQGFREMELSWVLEENAPTRHIIEAAGGQVHKVYRVYEKDLA